MSVIVTSETISSIPAAAGVSAAPVLENAGSAELLSSAEAGQIVVPSEARSSAKRYRKAEEQTTPQPEIECLREQLHTEKRLHTIQRATAEQARRVADCQIAFQEILIEQITQPCFVLNAEGILLRWNPAMARWTNCPASAVQSVPLAQIAGEETASQLVRACSLARAAVESANSATKTAVFSLPEPFRFGDTEIGRVTLIPHCRIPGCVESYLILVTPQT